MSGTLVVCGAPIGNPRDASPRLGEVLATADVVAAEDTRRLRRLTQSLGVTVTGRVVSYFEGNEQARTPMLAEQLRAGATVALVTDGGMPAVSDPGFRLVAAAVHDGIPVTVVPGPSAATAAIAVSGLPSDRWTFEGFLPRKAGDRAGRLAELTADPRTLVFLEAPHRLAVTLAALVDGLGGDRAAVLCRELTKTWEQVVRGSLAELSAWSTDGREVRGEITLVVAGAPAAAVAAFRSVVTEAAAAAGGRLGEPTASDPASLAEAVGRYTAQGMAPKDAQ
nr:16S rRNA (cytidine(1402)-2'-O)-methyltransferase [Micromonospora sp. DSM 115978]